MPTSTSVAQHLESRGQDDKRPAKISLEVLGIPGCVLDFAKHPTGQKLQQRECTYTYLALIMSVKWFLGKIGVYCWFSAFFSPFAVYSGAVSVICYLLTLRESVRKKV